MTPTENTNLLIGVLELQGDFAEHTAMLRHCGVKTKGIRLVEDLEGIHGLVIPGGESTTIGKLLVEYNMLPKIQDLVILQGLPVFGTCAGCILLAKEITQPATQMNPDKNQPRIGVMDIAVERNSYGSQIASFEAYVESDCQVFGENTQPIRAVLIRAPRITSVGEKVQVLAHFKEQDHVLVARQGNALACTFHPELTRDNRVHRYFINMVREYVDSQTV